MTDVIRIGNCSGFYGDRLAAAREMIDGGPIDVLTGDYLAELTMSILYNQQQTRGEDVGYVGTFLKQLKDVAADCKARNIKIVTNAGGLNPKGMADEVEKILAELGVDSKVAYIDGDNLLPELDALQADGEKFTNLDTEVDLKDSTQQALTSNAYSGRLGHEALDQGADIVICPRVTDAAVVIGPAAWKFNWQRNDYDALAGALAAGHIIECGAQCCGGNYAFFEEVPSFHNVGYPIAEIEANGNFTITKHPGTGGLISEGTVKAQLLYEISTPAYYNPDVIAHFDTMSIEQTGEDPSLCQRLPRQHTTAPRIRCVSTLADRINSLWRLCLPVWISSKRPSATLTLFFIIWVVEQFDDVDVQLIRSDHEDPESNEVAHAALRVTITHHDPSLFGRLFAAKVTELGLAGIPGNTGRGAQALMAAQRFIVAGSGRQSKNYRACARWREVY